MWVRSVLLIAVLSLVWVATAKDVESSQQKQAAADLLEDQRHRRHHHHHHHRARDGVNVDDAAFARRTGVGEPCVKVETGEADFYAQPCDATPLSKIPAPQELRQEQARFDLESCESTSTWYKVTFDSQTGWVAATQVVAGECTAASPDGGDAPADDNSENEPGTVAKSDDPVVDVPVTPPPASTSPPRCYNVHGAVGAQMRDAACGEPLHITIPRGATVYGVGEEPVTELRPGGCRKLTDRHLRWVHITYNGQEGWIWENTASRCCRISQALLQCFWVNTTGVVAYASACGTVPAATIPRGTVLDTPDPAVEEVQACIDTPTPPPSGDSSTEEAAPADDEDPQPTRLQVRVKWGTTTGWVDTTSVYRHSCGNLTVQQLQGCMPGATCDLLERYLPHLNYALMEADVRTPVRQAALLAQMGHESNSFVWMEELASGTAYEGRRDLGNTQPGDGPRFKGRGPIQLTGRANYEACEADLHLGIVRDPGSVTRQEKAFRTSLWFWDHRGLNAIADGNTQSEFDRLTRRINGGLNGKADRDERWAACKPLLGVTWSGQ